MASDQRRDHLGVGGDLPMDPQSVLDSQVGVVVDVTVERGDDVRAGILAALSLDLFAVERMGVGFGDDADARPPRVSEDGDLGIGRGEGAAKHGVARDTLRAAPWCCRRALRSRRPPCRRTTGSRRSNGRTRIGTMDRRHVRPPGRRRSDRIHRARGSRRRGGVRPSRGPEPRDGRSPTRPAARRGNQPSHRRTRRAQRATQPPARCAAGRGGSPMTRHAGRRASALAPSMSSAPTIPDSIWWSISSANASSSSSRLSTCETSS